MFRGRDLERMVWPRLGGDLFGRLLSSGRVGRRSPCGVRNGNRVQRRQGGRSRPLLVSGPLVMRYGVTTTLALRLPGKLKEPIAPALPHPEPASAMSTW